MQSACVEKNCKKNRKLSRSIMSTHLFIQYHITIQRKTECSPYLVEETDIQTQRREYKSISDCVKKKKMVTGFRKFS